jgi:hypothetical protein
MSTYEIIRDDERLTLATPVERRMLLVGCPLFLFAVACLLVLGAVTLVYESHHVDSRSAGDPSHLFNPHANQFGFLWLIACLFIAITLPLYAWVIKRASNIFTFDLAKGALLRHGKPLIWLGRIEYLQIKRVRDVDHVSTYKLQLVYGDGRAILLDECQEEWEMRLLAEEIAGFIGVDVHGVKTLVH